VKAKSLGGVKDAIITWSPFRKSKFKFRGSPTHLQVLAAVSVPLRVVLLAAMTPIAFLWSWATIIPQLVIMGIILLLGHRFAIPQCATEAIMCITNLPHCLFMTAYALLADIKEMPDVYIAVIVEFVLYSMIMRKIDVWHGTAGNAAGEGKQRVGE
jgi:hypothetical protein